MAPSIKNLNTVMSSLFTPWTIGNVTFRNRIFMSPMCQYSAEDGFPNDWHFVHLGSRAVGGAGLVMLEASAVVPEGRISYGDLGLWQDAHIPAFRRQADFIRAQGAVPGIQIGHAGRKASCDVPWRGGHPLTQAQGAWQTVAPSAIPFSRDSSTPHALQEGEIKDLITAFAETARRADEAGMEMLEIHGAHGYLLHEFASPLSNQRDDDYGGSLANRCRFPLEVVRAVRHVWPQHKPLFYRVSAVDWEEGGWAIEDTLQLACWLQEAGVDVLDCSAGGSSPAPDIPVGPGYQTEFAARVRRETGMATGAVGLITDPVQAEHIVHSGQADCVLLAREMLRDPYFPLRAAQQLHGQDNQASPVQYQRAFK